MGRTGRALGGHEAGSSNGRYLMCVWWKTHEFFKYIIDKLWIQSVGPYDIFLNEVDVKECVVHPKILLWRAYSLADGKCMYGSAQQSDSGVIFILFSKFL